MSINRWMNKDIAVHIHNGIFSSVQSLSHVWLFATPWTVQHCQVSLSITNSQSPPKPMSIESVMPSNHLILCCPLLLLPSIFPSIRVFSNESAVCTRWPKYWGFSFNISPSNYSAIKRNTFKSALMTWMNLEPIILSAVSKKEKDKYRILIHIYRI